MSHAPLPTSPPSWGSSAMPVHDPQLDNLIKHFYIKTAHIILQSRLAPPTKQHRRLRLNKWFNITTEEYPERLRHDLRYWYTRALGSTLIEPPRLIIDVFLDVPHLPPPPDDDERQLMLGRQPLFLDEDRRRIILERWVLTLSSDRPSPSSRSISNIYKRATIFFRSLYSFSRVLPASNLQRSIVHNPQHELTIGYRLSSTNIPSDEEIGLDEPLHNEHMEAIDEHTFTDLQTPLGSFKVQVLYRKHTNFHVQEQDPSARLIDLDQHYFMPTIAKFAKRSPPAPPWPDTSPSSRSNPGTNEQQRQQQKPRRPSSVVIPPPSPTRIHPPHASSPPNKSLSLSPASYGSTPSSTMTSSRPTISFSSSFKNYQYSQSAPPLNARRNFPATAAQQSPSSRALQRQSLVRLAPLKGKQKLVTVEHQEEDKELESFVRALSLAKPWRSPSLAASSASLYKSKQALTHFKSLRSTVDTLSRSMTTVSSAYPAASLHHQYRPRSPSPLHNMTTVPAAATSIGARWSLPLAIPHEEPSFMSSPRLHEEDGDLLASSSSSSSTLSSVYHESLSSLQPTAAPGATTLQPADEDDDSLIFRMSELELQ